MVFHVEIGEFSGFSTTWAGMITTYEADKELIN